MNYALKVFIAIANGLYVAVAVLFFLNQGYIWNNVHFTDNKTIVTSIWALITVFLVYINIQNKKLTKKK